jgi:hypothetical protein
VVVALPLQSNVAMTEKVCAVCFFWREEGKVIMEPPEDMSYYHSFDIELTSPDRANDVIGYLRTVYMNDLKQFDLGVDSVTISTSSSGVNIEVRHAFGNREKFNHFMESSGQVESAMHARLIVPGLASAVVGRDGRIVYQETLSDAAHSHASESHRANVQVQRDKEKWPELKNLPLEEVRKIISAERPDLQLYDVPQGSMVTCDMRMDRVRIFHKDGKVTTIPKVG